MSAQGRSAKLSERLSRWSPVLGITVWFLHLNTLNALTSVACEWNWFTASMAGLPGLAFVEMIITLVAAVLILGLIYLPWTSWRKYQTEKPMENKHLLEDTEKDRRALVAFVAMLLNCLFLLFVIATLVPMLALRMCNQG